MSIRESGMPDQERWESFFNPITVLTELGIDSNCRKIIDFGCGFGTFAIPAAQISHGIVYAIDIDAQFIAECKHRAKEKGLRKVKCIQRDFILEGVNLPVNEVNFAMLFNILHAEDPVSILKEAYRVLSPLGKVGIIHWNYDASTPRGPSMEIRPRPEQCLEWMKSAGFVIQKPFINIPPYHYGIVGQKPQN
jgi:ubiquinone/menaquinone biosynthesis C-methylase UbiE